VCLSCNNLIWPRSNHHIYDYHLSTSIPGRDSFLAFLQYLDTIFIAPIMKNPLRGKTKCYH
jgi:hypothetical protein